MTDLPNLSLAIDLSATGGERLVFDVRQFEVQAEMNRPFQIGVTALIDRHALDLEEVIGAEAWFVVAFGDVDVDVDVEAVVAGELEEVDGLRVWKGLVREIRHAVTETEGLSTYEVEIVPAMWLLTQRTNNSIFQHQSEVEIVRDVFEEWAIPLHLDGSKLERGGVDLDAHRRREYRTQYEETDFDFVNRMLEESGIAYFFDSSAAMQGDMVLSDAPELGPKREEPLTFEAEPSNFGGRAWATQLRLARRVAPGKVSLVDYDFRRPPLEPLIAVAEGGRRVEQRLDVFEYRDGHFLYISGDAGDPEDPADAVAVARTDLGEGQRLALKRLRAQRARAREITFRTNVYDIDVGQLVRVDGHPYTDDEPDGLLVTAITFEGAANEEWKLEVTGVSVKEAYRPPLRTPRPVASGVESATVVGRAGKEIDVDKHGRVKVFFHWDRDGQPDEHSSCWIHASHGLGGAGYGAVLLPRVGQEVLVAFLGSDPDRPIIVGRYYTSLQKPPRKFPDDSDAFVIRSNSLGNTGGANELCMRDVCGHERFDTIAQKDRKDLTKNNRADTVRHNDRQCVGIYRGENIGSTWTVDVGERTRISSPQLTICTDATKMIASERFDIEAKTFKRKTELSDTVEAKTIKQEAEISIAMKAGNVINLEAATVRLKAGDSELVVTGAGIFLNGAKIALN